MRDLVASVQQRLRNAAEASGRPVQDVMQYYGTERFLYRLSESRHADLFLLKGALMLSLWHGAQARATRDIDVQGRMDNSPEAVQRAIAEICAQDVEQDGVVFDATTVEVETIVEDGVYQGVRAKFWGRLGNVKLRMKVDVGFGDPVVPAPVRRQYPTILDFPPPVLLGYTPESAIAEKLEAMVKLGLLNGRMKDYHDIWRLSQQLDFEGDVLAEAVRQTFGFRGTEPVPVPEGLTPGYAEREGNREMWRAFLRRHQLTDADLGLDEVVSAVAEFLLPLLGAVCEGRCWPYVWHAPGPWQPA